MRGAPDLTEMSTDCSRRDRHPWTYGNLVWMHKFVSKRFYVRQTFQLIELHPQRLHLGLRQDQTKAAERPVGRVLPSSARQHRLGMGICCVLTAAVEGA